MSEALFAAAEYVSQVFFMERDVCSMTLSLEAINCSVYLDSLSVRMSTSSDRITCGSRLSSSRMAFSISLSDFVCSNASLEFSRNRSSNSFLSVPIIRVSNCWCRLSTVIWKLMSTVMF